VLAAVQPDPGRAPDRLSAHWLLALAAKLVRDVGELLAGATRERKRVATFALDGEVRFASASDRAAFAQELTVAVAGLVSKYHDESAPHGRAHRVVVAVHPAIAPGARDEDGADETDGAAKPQTSRNSQTAQDTQTAWTTEEHRK
jgi:hypothetical protein